MAERCAHDEREVIVVLRIATDPAPSSGVSGRIESEDGGGSFHGWLDLLGKLEALVERTRDRVRGGSLNASPDSG